MSGYFTEEDVAEIQAEVEACVTELDKQLEILDDILKQTKLLRDRIWRAKVKDDIERRVPQLGKE